MVSSVLGLKRRTPRDFPSRSSARRSRSGASSTGSTARSFGRAPASPGSARGLEVAVFLILSKTIDVLLSPLVWSMILLAVGAWLSESRGSSARPGAESGRRKTARRICFGASLGLLYVLSTRSADRILMTAIESSAVDSKRDGVSYEAVIVLGGFVSEPGPRQSVELSDGVDRLTMAFQVLARDEARYAILVGGSVRENVGEAASMRELLVSWGIAPERLIVDDRSQNTRDNAKISKEIAEEHGFQSLLLITSAFHMQRAEGCFRAVGLPVDTLPVDYLASPRHGFLPRAHHLRTSEIVIRELAGRLIYRVMGYSRSATAAS